MSESASRQSLVLVRNAAERGDWPRALEACQQWILTDPENPNGFFWLSSVLLESRRNVAALKAAQTANMLDGQNPKVLTQLARCYSACHREREAYAFAMQALAAGPCAANELDSLGVIFTHLGSHEKAAALFEEAVALVPENPKYHANLGNCLHFCNESEKAEQALQRAIAMDGRNYRAHWAISQLRKQTVESNHIENLEKLLEERGLDETGKIYVEFALAKEYEDIGRFRQSFEHLVRGNNLVAAMYPHDERAEEAYFGLLRQTFTAELFADPPKGYPEIEPIFIVGLPRTGTTLLEQMLGAHSAVFAAGELHAFGREFSRAVATPARQELKRGIEKIDFETLGRNYSDAVEFRVERKRTFTDKYPINYQLAGPIGLSLPNAKIVHVHRNPMDTCFSNYKQLFSLGSMRHCYNLMAMGRHYLRYRSLMEHWRRVMPGRILDVTYEELVKDTEVCLKRVLNTCNLSWEDAVLQFHESNRSVATASAAQVRQPIHRESVGRWRKHAEHLSGLIELLSSNGIRVS